LATPETSPTSELSEREREILRLVATGASNKEVAQRLYISPNTVKVHLRNIFAKIGVASRTEATLYAIRQRLAPVAEEAALAAEDNNGTGQRPSAATASALAKAGPMDTAQPTAAAGRAYSWQRMWPAVALVTALAILLLGLGFLVNAVRPWSIPSSPTPPPVVSSRWQTKAEMPTARSGLAVATYENEIYVIGGETTQGVTATVEQYHPASDTWATLAPKPIPVADVSAAVIGGWIYVPGGLTSTGAVTDVLEAYDPRGNRWEQRASLPVALSAYALVAFEGRLYLFGGWDGHGYVATVYAYDPSRDQWTNQTPMPTARGYPGAAVTGDKIYVMGGTDGTQTLAVTEAYVPEAEARGENPWQTRAPLPAGRLRMGVVSVAGIVHVMGGEGSPQLSPLIYDEKANQWQPFQAPNLPPVSKVSLAVESGNIHLLGGQIAAAPSRQHIVYQAIYVIQLPLLSP